MKNRMKIELECKSNVPISDAVRHDLQTLSKMELRRKYKKEATSHRGMKDRCRKSQRTGSDRNLLAPEWEDFAGFLRDMGAAPSAEHSLDRIDCSDPVYGPGKVRWATKEEQTRNRSTTVLVTYRGEEMPLSDYADRLGVAYKTAYSAIITRNTRPDEYARRILSAKISTTTSIADFPAPFNPDRFVRDYKEWRRSSVEFPDRRAQAHIEAYYLYRAIKRIKLFENAAVESGLYECASEEELAAHSMFADYERVKIARQMMRAASCALAEKMPRWRAGNTEQKSVFALISWLTAPRNPA